VGKYIELEKEIIKHDLFNFVIKLEEKKGE
jgi:hypothetical protein